jgi:metallo-beta-lactamase family protein
MKLKFCGAAREVTGSSHLLILDDGFRILLDCGLYQGNNESMENFNDRWLFEPGKLDCLIVSHAHIDHTGRIPKLVGDGFVGKIYSTHATRDLCGLMLLDSAKIQEGDAAYNNKKRGFNEPEEEPLYTLRDVQQTMRHFISHEYEQWFRIHPKVKVLFRDAGHILGSASVTLEIEPSPDLGSRAISVARAAPFWATPCRCPKWITSFAKAPTATDTTKMPPTKLSISFG